MNTKILMHIMTQLMGSCQSQGLNRPLKVRAKKGGKGIREEEIKKKKDDY